LKEPGVSFRKFIRNRNYILGGNLRERFMQVRLQLRVIRPCLLLEDVTLSLRLVHVC
jgi:hypothetical protein